MSRHTARGSSLVSRPLKAALLGAAAALSLSAAASAQAPDVAALEDRIVQLEAMLAELRGEVLEARRMAEEAEAMSHESADAVIRLDQRVQSAETQAAPAAAEGFAVGDTRITYGGYVDLDIHLTDTSDGDIAGGSVARDFYIPGAIPVGGRAKAGSTPTSPPRPRASSSPPKRRANTAR